MKLLKLYVDGYKNLNNINFDFSKANGRALIVGTNGSGKSNLIEVLSAIFYACYYEKKNVEPDFRFELEYIIERLRTARAGGDPSYALPLRVMIRNVDGKIDVQVYQNNEWLYVNKKEWFVVLPEHVIAIYSGEEKRLWEKYYFDSYEDFNKQYMSGEPYSTQRMLYFNKYYWDLFVSILSIHDIEEHRKFLETISILDVGKIKCTFDLAKIRDNKNEMVKEILKIINPNNLKEVEIPLNKYEELKFLIGYEQEILFNMMVLVLYKKFKIITDFHIICSNERIIKDLSEGEKKLLVIYGALNIVEGENLVLLDEPDAHIHEGIKKEICDLIKSAGAENQFIITSHSPTMTNLFDANELFVLTKQDGTICLLDEDKKHAISRLTDGVWCAEAQCVLLEGGQDLLLVEGKGDTKYIKKAFSYFKNKDEKYNALNLFVLPFGGAGNCADFIQNIIEAGIVNRKIIALFDADGAGREKFSGLVGRDGVAYTEKVYTLDNDVKALLLPKQEGNTNEEFMIEDYFDLSGYEAERERRYALCKGAKDKGEFKFSPKKYISEHCDEIGYEGFQILCDKLLNLLNES